MPKPNYLRVDAPSIDSAVRSAGADWAGRSEVPLSQFTAAQLLELKNDWRLEVTEIERDEAEPEAQQAQG